MLVQALAEYADHYLAEELKDAAWETKPVPWQINITKQGKYSNITPRWTTDTSGKKPRQVAQTMRVPRSPVNRNSGEHPLLGTDDLAYVLGAGSWTSDKAADKEKAEKHHAAFIELIRSAATETGDEALASCVRFYENAEEVEKARAALDKAKAGELAVLAVGYGEPLVEREAINKFWNEHYRKEYATERVKGATGECIVSGKFGPIAITHEKIKGLSNLGGQASGVSLMSFDKEAFRSYGWEQNQNSPVSPNRALAYVLALNDLLKQEKGRRVNFAGIGFLYWLKNPDDINAIDLMDRYDPKQVKDKLVGKIRNIHLDPNRFYMVAVSGNGGRLRVHLWVDLALSEVQRNIEDWDKQLLVEYPKYSGEEPPPVRLWQLLYALDRDGKPDDHTVLSLIRRRIEGQPLGYSVLSATLAHLCHSGENEAKAKDKAGNKKSDPMSPTRLRVPIGLIRMCINDLFRQFPKKGYSEMSEGLDESCKIPAYVCGRLMAAYEDLQRTTARKSGVPINTTITDRFFSLASTCPSAAFAEIIDLGQKHLKKLRGLSGGAASGIEKRIMKISNLLQPGEKGPYPSDLSLEDQGLFALGYFHQKSRLISDATDVINGKLSQESSNQDDDKENQK
jgi:CRISPR-associated protein Csd1